MSKLSAIGLTAAGLVVMSAYAGLEPNFPAAGAQERRRTTRSADQSGEKAPGVQQGSIPVTPDILMSPDEDYVIGPSDVLQISVQDAPELSGTFRVNASGSITMPFLRTINVAGMTPEKLQQVIEKGLRGEYLTDPQATVSVAQYNSRSFFIQGAVRTPGVYMMEGRRPSILKLITMAGGLADNHGSTAFIIREIRKDSADQVTAAVTAKPAAQSTPAGQSNPGVQANPAGAQDRHSDPDVDDARYELRKVNINSLLQGNFGQNVIIQPGDIINIPSTDLFFVAGEVRSAGSYTLRDGTTLRQAISLAQGLTFRARPSRGVIFREDPTTGKREEIKVDIGQVMSGKKADVPILANDVIIVPNSRFKSVSSTLLTAFGTTARMPVY